MRERGSLDAALYNPDLVDRRGFIAQFVARQPLLDRVVEDLGQKRPQHLLLLGQRGMGKSTLLRRVRFAVEDDRSLAQRWTPLTFPEEQYNVASLSDFWANCLDALSDTIAARGDLEGSRALDRKIDELPREEVERARVTLALLRECGKKLKRGFVLLIDNLDIVLDRLEPQEQWALRKACDGADMVLVGSCVAPPESAFSHEGAFYDWFKVEELRPLSLAEAQQMLLRIAEVRKAPQVAEIVRDDPGRVAALHQLTGGNPRTLMLLHDLFARNDVRSVEQDLVALLDHCTPLYKARFESLSQQQQQVMHALALHWAPATVAEIAEQTRLAVQGVSSQLDRLVKQGVVEKVPSSHPRQLFQVAERFFNIWYLMRASRRMRRTLIWLAEFLRIFYGEPAMRLRARELSLAPLPLPVDERERHLSLMMAIAQVVDDRGLRSALEVKATEAIVDTGELRARVAEILDLRGDDAHLGGTVDRISALREMEAGVLAAKVRMRKGWQPKRFWRLLGGAATLTLEEKQRVVTELPAMEPEKLRALMGELAAEERRWLKGTRTKRLPEAIRRGYMQGPTDVDGAAAVEPECGQGLVDEAMLRAMEEKPDARELERIGAYLPHAVEPATWAKWMSAAGEKGASVEEFRRWIDQTQGEKPFWRDVITLYLDMFDRSTASSREESARRALTMTAPLLDRRLQLAPRDIELLRTRSEIASATGDTSKAADLLLIITASPKALPSDWNKLGSIQGIMGDWEEAKLSWRHCLELDANAWQCRINLARRVMVEGDRSEGLGLLHAGPRKPELDVYTLSIECISAPIRWTNLKPHMQRALHNVHDVDLLFECWFMLWSYDVPLHGDVAVRINKTDTTGLRRDIAMTDHWLKGDLRLEARNALSRTLATTDRPGDLSRFTRLLFVPLSSFVRYGLTAVASEAFDASPLAERLLPLRDALHILAFPDRYSIDRLPAEVREATRECIDALMGILGSGPDSPLPIAQSLLPSSH